MFGKVFAAALAVTTIGMMQPASAAVIKFNQNNGWTTGSLNFTNGSESVDVSAANVNTDGSVRSGESPYLASWNSGGLGVCNGGLNWAATGGCSGDSHMVDGEGSDEITVFDFGSLQVSISKVVFTHVNEGDDDFALFNYGNGLGAAPTSALTNVGINGGKFQRSVSGLVSGVGSVFGIGAQGDDDEFKIKKIVFTVHQGQQQPQPVPLPAAGWMLLAGLGGLRLMRSRKA